jgi:hypothetical protein
MVEFVAVFFGEHDAQLRNMIEAGHLRLPFGKQT